MPKLRNIIALVLVAGVLWHFYGETYQQSGFQGVGKEIRSDVIEIKENPTISTAIDTLNQELQLLLGGLSENLQNSNQQQPVPAKPELDAPSEQSFSVHNVELGDKRAAVDEQTGKPERASLNEYGVDWVAYHENYHNFFMAAYDEQNNVAGLYTNQDLLTSTLDIALESSRESVLHKLGEPVESIRKGWVNYQVQNNEEYDTFLIDNTYVTVFYDKHENNTVTAIQLITKELEQQKQQFFGEPSESLKQGFEYQLFDLTNAARVQHGLSVLAWEEPVRETARDHSKDMAVNNYFSHTNLEGQSPFDRMSEDNIRYRAAGENLATGQPSSIFAHEGLMNSLGHRENILKAGYTSLAVGVAFNSEAQPFYTENFLTK